MLLTLKILQRALGGVITGGQLLCAGPGHSAADRSLSVKLDDAAPDGFVVHSFSGDDPIACKDYVRARPRSNPSNRTAAGSARQRPTSSVRSLRRWP